MPDSPNPIVYQIPVCPSARPENPPGPQRHYQRRRAGGMSESGTRKYIAWETRYPYIFQIDIGKLK